MTNVATDLLGKAVTLYRNSDYTDVKPRPWMAGTVRAVALGDRGWQLLVEVATFHYHFGDEMNGSLHSIMLDSTITVAVAKP